MSEDNFFSSVSNKFRGKDTSSIVIKWNTTRRRATVASFVWGRIIPHNLFSSSLAPSFQLGKYALYMFRWDVSQKGNQPDNRN